VDLSSPVLKEMETVFFTSVAKNICNNPEIWVSKLREFGIERVQISDLLVTKLRQILVSELTGERKQQYKDFVTHDHVDYRDETEKFLIDGYYDSEIGNLMPLAMAEALESNFVLFRIDDNKPFFRYSTVHINSSHNISSL
jgi:hypothetical protein